MDGDAEESDEDVQAEEKRTVLWEKCIQQSIFVDLSEDESLHLSDLENSLAVHFSQAESVASEPSIHLSGSAELSELDNTSSESGNVSSQSEMVVENKNQSSILHESPQRPNTMQDELPLNCGCEDSGENTSDEDQEDLPYDGYLGSPYFNQTTSSEGNISSDGRDTVHASPIAPDDTNECPVSVEDSLKKLASLAKEEDKSKHCNSCDVPEPSEVALPCPSPVDINQLLLRHFSKEELMRSGRLIEAETLPEVSLLDSVDDTVISLALAHNSTVINRNHPESTACDSELNLSVSSGTTDEKSNNASRKSTSENEEGRKMYNICSSASDSTASRSASTGSNQGSGGDSTVEVANHENAEEERQDSKVPFVRTRSFSDMKYGQGQVHYPLPDFSKVAPKVKIPKAPGGPARPVPQSPSTMHRAQSSPGMLEVISRVLEDSVLLPEKPYVFKEEDNQTSPALVHHLQSEYDKLLTKYAEAENLIDQMRLGTNTQPSSELMFYSDAEYHQQQLHDDNHQRNLVEGSHLGSLASHLSPSENIVEKGATSPQSAIKEVNTTSSSQPEDSLSDGEVMTAELRDIINQFMQKVKEFKLNLSSMSVNTAEQQMMLRSMMEAQDQLERKYISKKEEHRALEMQNYMGLSRNTGSFDPDRLVEGDIFRIGMHLEDIKEMIDKNVCEQISPPQSSSTPTSTREMLHVKPLFMSTCSPPPSLHEGPSAGFSAMTFKTETQNVEEKEEEVDEASEVHGGGGGKQSSEITTTDSFLKNTGCHIYSLCSPEGSVEDLNIQTAETDEENKEESISVLSEGIDERNILAYVSSLTSRQRERTLESSDSILDSVLNSEGECDVGDWVSLAVEVTCSYDPHSPLEPPVTTSSRIVSPETDSGFGSSYLNQSGSGSLQSNLLTESVLFQNSSESEGSCSNLQTAIHSATLTSQQWDISHPPIQKLSCGAIAAAAVEHWVDNTTKEPSVRLQGSDSCLHEQIRHHRSAPLLSTNMDKKMIGNQSNSCSCNSEAILALQSEVLRLKKDLEEGLVQLPQIAQRMDYLSSKYRQDRQERKSKTRPRTHQKSTCNSVLKPSSNRQNVRNLVSSPAKIDDWISSDMEPSMSKGTDSGDTAGSESMLQFHSSPLGSRRGIDYRLQHTLQHSRGLERSEKAYGFTNSSVKVVRDEANEQRLQTSMESIYSKERWSVLSSPALHKPLLQVNYGSSSSLPASYKVREPLLQSGSCHRKRSTQSDTALLPSNVYFQRTSSPVSLLSKTGSRTGRRRGSKEDDMNRTLDQAIEVARSMKRTTDRMAKRLSADLAKAQLYRKQHNIQPLGGRKHPAV